MSRSSSMKSLVPQVSCLLVVALGLQVELAPLPGGELDCDSAPCEASTKQPHFFELVDRGLHQSQRRQPPRGNAAESLGRRGRAEVRHSLQAAGSIFDWLAGASGSPHMMLGASALGKWLGVLTADLSHTAEETLWGVVLAVILVAALAAFAFLYFAVPLYKTEEKQIVPAMPSDLNKEAEPRSSDSKSGILVLICVALALLFNGFIFATEGPLAGEEWLACYALEYSLSVDNLFIFIVIFDYFKLPLEAQATCLNYGIWGAVVFRFVFVFLGAELLQKASFLILPFGLILIYTSYKGFTGGDGDDEDEEDEDLEKSWIVSGVNRLLGVSNTLDRNNFFTRVDGRIVATPLFVCLLVIEISDIVFATDSVPAVLATTDDPFIAYSSNVFAIFGLRSLFFVLKDAMIKFTYLEPAVNAVLGFIGVKIMVEYFRIVEVPVGLSLLIVLGTLGTGVLLSLRDAALGPSKTADIAG